MSSILTNNSAMVALDTLRGINKDLAGVQSEISTGKKIGSSTDNAAIWSISEITKSVQSIVDSASSNGQNLLKGAGSIDVLSSLNRQSDGTVEAGKVNVQRQNLSTEASSFVTASVAGATSAGTTATENSAGTAPTITIAAGETTESQTYQVTVGDTEVSYVAEAGLDQDAIAQGFSDAINSALDGTAIADTLTATVTDNVITLTNSAPVATTPSPKEADAYFETSVHIPIVNQFRKAASFGLAVDCSVLEAAQYLFNSVI